ARGGRSRVSPHERRSPSARSRGGNHVSSTDPLLPEADGQGGISRFPLAPPPRASGRRCPMSAALVLENVHKSFNDHEVLKGIDLAVAEHEVVCLIGASGSGKSTLLRCVNLLEPIDEGRIVVGDREITAPGVDVNAVRRGIGIVFQAYNLFPPMTVLANGRL